MSHDYIACKGLRCEMDSALQRCVLYSSSLPNSNAWYLRAFLLGLASDAPFRARDGFVASEHESLSTRKIFKENHVLILVAADFSVSTEESFLFFSIRAVSSLNELDLAATGLGRSGLRTLLEGLLEPVR